MMPSTFSAQMHTNEGIHNSKAGFPLRNRIFLLFVRNNLQQICPSKTISRESRLFNCFIIRREREGTITESGSSVAPT